MEKIIEFYKQSTWNIVFNDFIVLLVGCLIGYIIAKITKGKKALEHLEDFIMSLSGVIFILVTVLDACNIAQSVSASFLGVFSTIIFSWLLTKKSSEIQFKKEEEKIAKLSHRRIQDIEKAVLGMQQYIQDMKEEKEVSTKEILSNIDARIEQIKNETLSAKEDWNDLLSDEYKKELHEKEEKQKRDYGKKKEEINASPQLERMKTFVYHMKNINDKKNN